MRLSLLYHVLFTSISVVSAQDCSATNLCATGCCSKYGYCGTGNDFCGSDNCVSTCDYKLGCDASNPCAPGTGCCSKFGFCGLGPNYCAPEVCVAGCDSKSYCDPGYSAPGYAEVETCPLNVCCSKWGFCGLTEEFCGTKTVPRPSCSTDGPLSRAVGYYEGWAASRPCKQIFPEDIPIGVYTHLNFAFAAIDPETFAVVPASTLDTTLYSQVTGIKRLQPGLKVFISIGGWTFNDPGPTATTFSDLAASPSNQAQFFASLISFMSTYDFDGVDIDWEYPAADDRSGRPEDFDNFPIFISNLKSALQSTGGRSGLSITLPASYWYLQHFDIIKLVSTVDFVNMMTYDLHGTWDKGNKWLGAFLNSHTNLTEITSALDLLWRNLIDPAKVNLGLAFYARTFTMSDPSCSAPGCMFDSGGDAGPCTRNVGTLSNAEIADIIQEKSLMPVHYTDAAVKVITWDDQWVAYDDADTYKQKADFARSECLGGVMVWAISEDSAEMASSLSLPGATKVNLGDVYQRAPTTTTSFIPQCRWSNCGEGCGDGWQAVPRSPSGTSGENIGSGETMQDGSYCGADNLLRQFCCPVDYGLPTCGWYNFNNGRCSGSNDCPSNMVEVGSNSASCNNFYDGGYENACCTVDVISMKTYYQCEWNGQPGNCDIASIPSWPDRGCFPQIYPVEVAMTGRGSGAIWCGNYGSGGPQERTYCCTPQSPTRGQFVNCNWYNNIGVVPGGWPDGFCRSGCPSNKVKIGLDSNSCNIGGVSAYCCEADYNIVQDIRDDPIYIIWASAMQDVTAGTFTCITKRLARDHIGFGSSIAKRATSLDSVFAAQLLYTILRDGESTPLSHAGTDLWNNAIGGIYAYLTTTNLLKYIDIAGSALTSLDSFVEGVVCNLAAWNQYVQNQLNPQVADACYLWNLSNSDPDFWVGDLDYTDSLSSKRKRGFALIHDALRFSAEGHELVKRTGGPREFKATVGTDTNGNPVVITLRSLPYPNGRGGQALIDATGSDARYTLANPADCSSTEITGSAAEDDSPQWVVEHILELQTAPAMIQFLASGQLPTINNDYITVPGFNSERDTVPLQVWTQAWTQPYNTWAAQGAIDDTEIPRDLFMAAFGSTANPNHLVLADAVLNNYKASAWAIKSPVSRDRWNENEWNAPIVANGWAALSALRSTLGIISYLQTPEILAHLQATTNAIGNHFLDFQNRVNGNPLFPGVHLDIIPLLREFFDVWRSRLETFIRCWVTNHIPDLQQTWQDVYNTTPDPVTAATAQDILDDLDKLLDEASPPSTLKRVADQLICPIPGT